ncbi:MAG: caspase family protein [bacterium]
MSEVFSGSVATVAIKSAYALIVGIGQYSDPRIRKLDFTHADAQAFCDLLLNPQHVGFLKENVKLLLDEQATLFNIKNAITGWLYKYTGSESTVIIFFAGHGGVESDKEDTEKDGIAKYLLPWDTNPDDLFASALSNTDFHRLLSTIKAQRLIIFLDACYAGGVAQRGSRDLGIVENPCERLAQGEGRLVISAAKPNQRSWEDPTIGHGIFTHHLLEALKGKADMDNDGYVSIWEVYKYLEREVSQSARCLAKSIQEPLFCGDMAKDIFLTADAQRIAKLAFQRSEAERRCREEIQLKRRKLFDLYDRGEFPSDAYQEAMSLIDKPLTEMTTKDSKLAKNLEALLKDGLSAEVYLENRDSIRSQMERKDSDRSPVQPPPQDTKSPGLKPPKTEMKYCIHCGTQINLQNKFCINCGWSIQ